MRSVVCLCSLVGCWLLVAGGSCLSLYDFVKNVWCSSLIVCCLMCSLFVVSLLSMFVVGLKRRSLLLFAGGRCSLFVCCCSLLVCCR